MPLKLIQQNERVAEVQFICDTCGRLIQTSLIPTREIERQKKQKTTCCICRESNLK